RATREGAPGTRSTPGEEHTRPVKYTGMCVKCHSRDLARVPGRAGGYGSGNVIPTGFINLDPVRVTRYVCCTCGFVEEWVDAAWDRDRLRSKFGGSAADPIDGSSGTQPPT
ncbi:MAG: hypothetical protein WCF36_16320, partial [Candidatus Nanopelagicales bacterium]